MPVQHLVIEQVQTYFCCRVVTGLSAHHGHINRRTIMKAILRYLQNAYDAAAQRRAASARHARTGSDAHDYRLADVLNFRSMSDRLHM